MATGTDSRPLAAPFLNVKEVARSEIPETATTVLLGESTHGTEEFYRLRAEITKYLIEFRGFKVVLCEADWPFLWHMNQYIHRKRRTMFPCDSEGEQKVRFPDWMWRNKPFVDLIEWMRKRASDDGPFLFGMDCYCKDESKEEVMKFLDRHDREGLGKLFRRSCYPQELPDRWPEVLSKLQWEIEHDDPRRAGLGQEDRSRGLATKKFRGCSKLDHFNCEQNLECMISAHEYYSKQRLEPPGSRASWNARDQHMTTTILRLKARSQEVFGMDELKVAVWAHNSHVGDATAMPTGGTEFTRNEKWNLGQMCRQSLDNVFICGFYTYTGTVRAAEHWGGEGKVMDLRCAERNSLEDRLHEWFAGTSTGYLSLSRLARAATDDKTSASVLYVAGSGPLGVEYCALHADVEMTRAKDEADTRPPGGEANLGDDFGMMRLRKIMAVPGEAFIAVKREVVDRYGTVKLQTEEGLWVTEYTPNGSRTVHCAPKAHFDSLAGGLDELSIDKLQKLMSFPILQRWVGVQYHPETEVQSHYGEMHVGRCYDLVLFSDNSKALDVNLEPAGETKPQDTAVAAGGPSNKRLWMEYRRIMKTPIENIQARPLDENILEWHFVLLGCQEPYLDGKYHGVLEFPDDFPMKPPSIKLLTPSGRFEVNKRICLSMSDFHAESWNPSWTVEKILIGLMSFMYEESTASIGSILESCSMRKRYAEESEFFNVHNEIYCELFCNDMSDEELQQKQKSRKLVASHEVDEEAESENACRFCLLDAEPLVSPCACRGSSRLVHHACLKQWQKSVILTQPTHPKYQTAIDAICNICETAFKDPFKPVSRRSVIMDCLKAASIGNPGPSELVQVSALLVSSRPKSERSLELMEKVGKDDTLRAKLGHFTQAIYFITLYEKEGRRGNGSVLAVNIERRRRLPGGRPEQVVEDKMPGMVGQLVSPARVWKWKYEPQLLRNAAVTSGILDVASIEHCGGGPVEPAHPFAIFEMADAASILKHSARNGAQALLERMRVKSGVLFGDLEGALTLLHEYATLAQQAKSTTARAALHIFWGYASWNGTQLLGEIARRGWGVMRSPEGLSMFEDNWEQACNWEGIVDTTVVAAENDFSRS